MEVEKETINMSTKKDLDYSSGEEMEDGLDLITTEAIEINPFDSKEVEYVLVGIFGNGSAFLKTSLTVELKASNTFKIKFMTSLNRNKNKPKRLVAELYQVKTLDNNYQLIIFAKEILDHRSFKFIAEYITDNFKYKKAVVFDSCHVSDFISETPNKGLYHLKNKAQGTISEVIHPASFPGPNTVANFGAYFLTYNEVKDVPCVVYENVTDVYDVSQSSVKVYDPVGQTYPFLKDKLTPEYLRDHNVSNLNVQFKEFNAFKNSYYV